MVDSAQQRPNRGVCRKVFPVTTVRQGLAAALIASLLLTGCAIGGTAEGGTDIPDATPKVKSLKVSPTTAPPGRDNFDTALEFTRLVHLGKHSQARSMVEANSPAARYITHQLADTKAYRMDGLSDSNSADDWTITGDAKTGKIRIKPTDGSASYTWRQFAFSGAGKITAWTGASGPIASVLWTRESKASGLGVTARLVSAYRTNAGAMRMVVDYSTTRDVELNYIARYTGRGGYRQNSTEQSSQDKLGKGEKTFTHYSFEDAKFGGTLRLKVASPDGYQTANLVLAIR